MNTPSLKIWLHVIAYTITLMAAGNTAITFATKISVARGIHNVSIILGIILSMIIIISIMYIFKKDNFFTLSSPSTFPCGHMVEKTPENWNTELPLKITPDTNIIYWAAEKNEDKNLNPINVYDKFANSGVARSDKDGDVLLKLRTPSSYIIDLKVFKKTIKPHIHYRICTSSGTLSNVKTKYF